LLQIFGILAFCLTEILLSCKLEKVSGKNADEFAHNDRHYYYYDARYDDHDWQIDALPGR
jgi:hypothetical protein